MFNEKPLRTNWTGTRTVRCTKVRTQHDIAHITTSTTAHCTTSSDITTRRHGVSPRFHNFDSFCFQPLQTADRLAQSGVATKLRSRFEFLRCVLTWVGDAWRRAVGHILTWVGDAWRGIGVTERDVLATDTTEPASTANTQAGRLRLFPNPLQSLGSDGKPKVKGVESMNRAAVYISLVVVLCNYDPTCPAAEPDWIDFAVGKSLDVFRGKPSGWYFAESVAVNDKNAKLLTGQPGNGILVNGEKGRSPDLYTKQEFGDVEIHLEFLMPKGSNSGLKFHGVYEIQLCDSFGKTTLTGSDCGGIYPRAETKPKYHHIDKGIAPKLNACKSPGEWQSLDVVFLAPRFGNDGKRSANAKIVKAMLNGQTIHENQELATPTGNNWQKQEKAKGPLMFQGDHGPVAFRNVKVRAIASAKP